MQKHLLEGVHIPVTDPPLLIGGQALHFYGLREGVDTDWILSLNSFQCMYHSFPEGYFRNAYGDEGIRLFQHEFYGSLFGLRYELLIVEARQSSAYLVASPEVLWCLKLATVLCNTHGMRNEMHL